VIEFHLHWEWIEFTLNSCTETTSRTVSQSKPITESKIDAGFWKTLWGAVGDINQDMIYAFKAKPVSPWDIISPCIVAESDS
jgi:hypothetical protein